MTYITIEIISRVEAEIPELKGKIQPGAVDAEVQVPYAACSIPEDQPIRTMYGIAGYETTFDLSVFHTRRADVERLKHQAIAALDRFETSGRRVYLKSGSDGYYDDAKVHGYNLTFKII